MRILIKKDQLIPTAELKDLQTQIAAFYKQWTGLKLTFFVEEMDYTHVPLETDSDGDTKPTTFYRNSLMDDVIKRYTDYGTDHVIMLVHEDNWRFKGIWGQNWSLVHGSMHFELCRWDRDNIANSFGTMYHEIHHSHDALVQHELGIDVDKIVRVDDWDQITHGKAEGSSYIRYKQNADSIEMIAPQLKAAYANRLKEYNKTISLMNKLISVARQLIGLKKANG